MSEGYNLRTELAAERRQGLRYEAEIASLNSQLADARKDRDRLMDALRFYSDTSGLLPFIRVRENDPYLNPDGPPDVYGLVDEICLPAREALAAMEVEKNG